MKNLDDVYIAAGDARVKIDDFELDDVKALTTVSAKGKCYIAIDTAKCETRAEEKVVLAHELGHCVTGSFYNIYSPCDLVSKHEYRADKRAALELIPPDELCAAMQDGRDSICELAEYFEVTEDFVRRAIDIYRRTIGDNLIA